MSLWRNKLGARWLRLGRRHTAPASSVGGPAARGRFPGCPTWALTLALVAAVMGVAQTASEKPSNDVRRVGARLRCQCGCKDSVATCSMLECEFSKPAKLKIAQMQAVGMSDDQIVQSFIRQYGAVVYLSPPSAFGWIVPYASVGVGLFIIWAFIKRYRKPKPLAEVGPVEIDDPALEKYKDQIEKDLANLD